MNALIVLERSAAVALELFTAEGFPNENTIVNLAVKKGLRSVDDVFMVPIEREAALITFKDLQSATDEDLHNAFLSFAQALANGQK